MREALSRNKIPALEFKPERREFLCLHSQLSITVDTPPSACALPSAWKTLWTRPGFDMAETFRELADRNEQKDPRDVED
jgi:hypothetical protein